MMYDPDSEEDLEPRTRFLNDALQYVVQTNKLDQVKILLDLGADLKYFCRITGSTPLLNAFVLGHMDIYKLLLKSETALKSFFLWLIGRPSCSYLSLKPSRYDLVRRNPELLSAIFELGIKPSTVDGSWKNWGEFVGYLTSGFDYIAKADVDFFNILLKFELVNPNIEKHVVNLEGHNFEVSGRDIRHIMMFSAVEDKSEELVQMLLDEGVTVDIVKDAYSEVTLLHAAARSGSLSVVKLLLQNGATYAKSDKSLTPLDAAFKEFHSEVVKFFTSQGYTSEFVEQYALHLACLIGDEKKVKGLVATGANLNNIVEYEGKIFHNRGMPPLSICIEVNNLSLLKFLVKSGAEVNPEKMGLRPEEHTNPILHAIHCKNVEALKILLRALCGRKKLKKCFPNSHKLLIRVAKSKSDYETFKTLVALGADIRPPCDQYSPLHAAARSGQIDLIEALVEKGVPMNDQGPEFGAGDTVDWRPLALCQDPECIKYLIENGADIHCRNFHNVARGLLLEISEVFGGEDDIAMAAIEHGLPVFAGSSEESMPPYLKIIDTGRVDLMKAYFDVCGPKLWEDTMVFRLACQGGHFELVEYLLKENPKWLQELLFLSDLYVLKHVLWGSLYDDYGGVDYNKNRYIKMIGFLLDRGLTLELSDNEMSDTAQYVLQCLYKSQRFLSSKLLQEWCGRNFTFDNIPRIMSKQFDGDLIRLLSNCGHKIQSRLDSCSNSNSAAVKEIFHQSISLQSCCRIKIRCVLFEGMDEYVHINKLIHQLPLPVPLIDFLCFSGHHEFSYLKYSCD